MRLYLHLVSNKVWGGGEQYVFDLCKHLQSEGQQVEVYCRPFEDVVSPFRSLSVPVHVVALKGVLDISTARKLAKRIQHESEVLIHVHNFKDAFTAAYARWLSGNSHVAIVVTRHLVKPAKCSLLYRWLYRQIDHVVFVSHLAKDTFLSSHPAIDESRLSVVHNSLVLPNEVSSSHIREHLNIGRDQVVGMYHGRLAEEKGIFVLMEAMSLLRDLNFELFVAGTGSQQVQARLHAVITEKSLSQHVHLLGFVKNIPSVICDADFGIIPSVARESFSLAGIEYMSQGRCVIATNHGGQVEYIEEGVTGLLVPPNDADALAAAIRRLVVDRNLCQQMGEQGQRKFLTQMNYTHFFEQIKKVYSDCMNGRSS